MSMSTLYCNHCQGWWQSVLRQKSRSKPRKGKAEESTKKQMKNQKSQGAEDVWALTPFSSRRPTPKESPGVRWMKGTPTTRLSVPKQTGEELPIPPAPDLQIPPAPPAVVAEVKSKLEDLKRTLGVAYTKEIEDKVMEAANVSLVAKPEIIHGVLNKTAQAKKQYTKAKEAVLEVDKEWKFFAETLKTAYDRERAAYVEQRASAMEELSTRKEKLKELQDAMRQSAMAQSLMEGEDVPQEGIMEDGYTIPPDPVEPISDEELLDDSMVKGRLPSPKPFSRGASASAGKRNEGQAGNLSKKPKFDHSGQDGEGK